MSSATRSIAEFGLETMISGTPDDVRDTVSHAFLDTIGVALAGSTENTSRSLLSTLNPTPEGVTAWGRPGVRLPPSEAALLNGTAGHALDFDDYNMEMFGHPSTVIIPALMAVAEQRALRGEDVLRAYAVGYEVIAAVGRSMVQGHYEQGFHPTGTLASLGAAAGVAALIRLPVEQACTSLGIAASMASGLRCNFGTDTKPLHAGLAASNGVRAALMAEAGLTSSHNVLDQPNGFVATMGGDPDLVAQDTDLLGHEWWLKTSPPIVKVFAACGMTHSGIAAALELRSRQSAAARDPEHIVVHLSRQATWPLKYHEPVSGLEGKFSMEYAVAAALLHGEAGLPIFRDAVVNAAEVQDLMRRVELRLDDRYEQMVTTFDGTPCRVEVARDGESDVCEIVDPPGTARNPATPEQIYRKFDDCSGTFLNGRSTQVRQRLVGLAECDDVRDLSLLINGAT